MSLPYSVSDTISCIAMNVLSAFICPSTQLGVKWWQNRATGHSGTTRLEVNIQLYVPKLSRESMRCVCNLLAVQWPYHISRQPNYLLKINTCFPRAKQTAISYGYKTTFALLSSIYHQSNVYLLQIEVIQPRKWDLWQFFHAECNSHDVFNHCVRNELFCILLFITCCAITFSVNAFLIIDNLSIALKSHPKYIAYYLSGYFN